MVKTWILQLLQYFIFFYNILNMHKNTHMLFFSKYSKYSKYAFKMYVFKLVIVKNGFLTGSAMNLLFIKKYTTPTTSRPYWWLFLPTKIPLQKVNPVPKENIFDINSGCVK